jgi:hypothetical protein
MKKTISGLFHCAVDPLRFPEEVALLYFPLDPKTHERRGRMNYTIARETWPAIRDRLFLTIDSAAIIEGYLRDGQKAFICNVEKSFEIEAAPHVEVPLIGEEIHLAGHSGTFRVTFVNDVAKTINAEHTNTLFSVANIPWSTINWRRPDHAGTDGNS